MLDGKVSDQLLFNLKFSHKSITHEKSFSRTAVVTFDVITFSRFYSHLLAYKNRT